MEPILVTGHRNPDTDAVCSALAYANLYQWQTGAPTIACHLDELAPETAWLLTYLELPAPRSIHDVYLRVADIMETRLPVLQAGHTLREAGQLMQDYQVRALPVVDDHGRLIGLILGDALATHTLDQLQLPEAIDLPVTLIQRTLEAQLLAGHVDAVLHDRVWIATMTAETARTTIGEGDIVIVGDQPDVQRAALAANAGCLIMTDGAQLETALLAQATMQNTVVLQTLHTPFAAALLLQQSIPVERIMTCDLTAVTLTLDTPMHEAKAHLRHSNLAGLAVVDDDGFYQGLLLRRHLTEQAQRQVILTDHNHPDQAAPGITESQIIAIIDHHNLGGLQTLQPLFMYCEPVGSTCTLIAELYRQMNAPLTPALAGAMLGAVISDTVQFRSPTTTQRDRSIAEWLAAQSGQAIDDLARRLFRARLPDPIPPPEWWVNQDLKIFTFGSTRLSISQVELAHVRDVMPTQAALCDALASLVTTHRLTSAFMLLTDILEQSSILLAANQAGATLAARAFGRALTNGHLVLPGVMSRKKQVVPALAAALNRL